MLIMENKYNENMLVWYDLQFDIEDYAILYLLVKQLIYDKDFYNKIVENNEIKRINLNSLLLKLDEYFNINDKESIFLNYYEFYTLAISLECIVNNTIILNLFYYSLLRKLHIKKSKIKVLYNKIDLAISNKDFKYNKIK